VGGGGWIKNDGRVICFSQKQQNVYFIRLIVNRRGEKSHLGQTSLKGKGPVPSQSVSNNKIIWGKVESQNRKSENIDLEK